MIRIRRSLSPSQVIFGLGLLILGIALGAVVSVAAQTDGVILACAGNNGSLRAVASHDECRNNETPMQWGVQGPPGENFLFDQSCPEGTYMTGITFDGYIICDGVPTGGATPICGNGEVEEGETCDDGNTVGNDGCSAECALEYCGNGVVEGTETCDDGNNVGGDGCSATCYWEGCGNGFVEPPEECDDGNTNNSDACANDCTLNVVCAPGEYSCNNVCTDLMNDPQNCGACGLPCPSGDICSDGLCFPAP